MSKIKNSKTPCYYCKTNMAEEKCVYCTECRLKMAKGEIKPNYGTVEKHICMVCKQEIKGSNQISRVICRACLDEI